MPAKKRPSQPPDKRGDPLETVLHALQSQKALIEERRSENRLTLEAVHTTHHRLGEQLEDVKREMRQRLDVLETVARTHSGDIRSLKTDVARVEAKVDKLVPLEDRVVALERRGA
jgi:uncharacterized protein involved in exopolysaccharide biosynthesis